MSLKKLFLLYCEDSLVELRTELPRLGQAVRLFLHPFCLEEQNSLRDEVQRLQEVGSALDLLPLALAAFGQVGHGLQARLDHCDKLLKDQCAKCLLRVS